MAVSMADVTRVVKGDQYGTVTVHFSVQALEQFITLLNMNKVRNHHGNRLVFGVDERIPGEAILTVTEFTPDAEKAI